MKKIISIMLSVLFIISSVNIVFAENERYSEEKIQEALGILKILDVISDDYTKDTAANQEVTRAEFSYYAVRLIKLQDYNQSTYFYDVPDSHWAFESINALASTGVVSGYGDHLFMPDQKISCTEATTILLRLFGYSSEYIPVYIPWTGDEMPRRAYVRLDGFCREGMHASEMEVIS